MKIRRIKFQNHPVLGDLDLDFFDPAAGSAANVVVLAGENGTGKTLILNDVYETLGEINLGRSWRIEIDIEMDVDGLKRWRLDGVLPVGDCLRIQLNPGDPNAPNWNVLKAFFFNNDGDQINTPAGAELADRVKRPLSVFYAEAESSFRPRAVSNVGTESLNSGGPAKRSSSSLATEIAQLLIDLRGADTEDLAQWVEAHPNTPPPASVSEGRLKIFRDAIDYIFPSKRLARVGRNSGRLDVEFLEHGRKSSLETLSTGEKQIIFRGGFFLRDLGLAQGGIMLIDEPELGLHPEWQSRIVGFYERLFPPRSESSTQLIFATHSPFVIHDQVAAKVLILRKDSQTGAITVDPDPTFPTTGQARVVNALNIPALIERATHEMVVLVEGETDAIILDTAWRKLRKNTRAPMEFRAALSDSAIRTTLKDDQLFAKNPGKKIVGLFDFDGAFNDWNGVWGGRAVLTGTEANGLSKKHPSAPGWALLLPVPQFRSALASQALAGSSALSIELLFEDRHHLSDMVEYLPLPAAGATYPKVLKAKKMLFARHVDTLEVAAFAGFEPLLRQLETIRASS